MPWFPGTEPPYNVPSEMNEATSLQCEVVRFEGRSGW